MITTPADIMANGGHSIGALADQIKRHADTLANFAKRQGLNPSLYGGDSLSIPEDEKMVLEAKSNIMGAMKELSSLVQGPFGLMMDIGANDILCLQAITRFNIAQAIGDDEEVEFEELSGRCGINVKDLQRILRYAMTSFIFYEPRPGTVAHSSASRLLANDEKIRDFVANVCEVRFPASARAVDAIELYGVAQNPAQSGFSLSRNTSRGVYEELSHFPEESRRWNGAMSALARQIDVSWVLDGFLKTTTSNERTSVIDVGGGRGDISLSLAPYLPNASFIVQDNSQTAIAHGQKTSADLRVGSRIQFQLYDFHTPQPCTGADIYYFRNIFHNWPDASCVTILRNQIPALKAGAQLLIDDFTLHEPGSLPWSEERRRRWMDINMLVFFGSRERSIDDWRELLATADPRFKLMDVATSPNRPNSMLRVLWNA